MKALKTPENDTCVIVWGRFQPPHIGHGKLFDTAVVLGNAQYKKEVMDPSAYPEHTPFGSLSRDDDIKLNQFLQTERGAFLQNRNADVFIMPTSTCKTPKDRDCERYPLHIHEKLKILNTIYPEDSYRFAYLNENSIDRVLSIFNKIYRNMVIVCGGDSVYDYDEKLQKYFQSPSENPRHTIAYAPVEEERYTIRIGDKNVFLSASLIRQALALCLDDIVKQGIAPEISQAEYTSINTVLVDQIINRYGVEKQNMREKNCETVKTNRGLVEEQLKDYAANLEEKEIAKIEAEKEKAMASRKRKTLHVGGYKRYTFVRNFMEKVYSLAH